jgi:hypothetical protein
LVAVPGAAFAQFTESEPNDSKAQANVFALGVGGTITGNSTSAAGVGLDYYRISTAAAALGIYRYRMVLTSNIAGHTGTIRGLNQVAGVPGTTDTTFQTSSTATTPPRFNQWYGFGKQEELYYRVTGTASTTADYTATLERQVVTPVDLGSFAAGSITITTVGQGHSTDTDLWVYDGNLDAIPGYGNDDHFGGTTLQSELIRNYTPGTYYLALSNFQFANNLGSPADDDFRTGALMDFPNVAANSSTTGNLNITFSIGGQQVSALKSGPYDVYWGKFTVVPEPASMTVLGLGVLALMRRRKAKKSA